MFDKYKPMETGMRFGSLVVCKRPQKLNLKPYQNLCVCDCGNALLVTTHILASGKKTDCGCVKRGRTRNDMYPARIKGLDNLASAVVARAAADYRAAYKQYLKKMDKHDGELTELRNFFKSEWCAGLTDLNTDILMNRIEQECIIEFERKKKKK